MSCCSAKGCDEFFTDRVARRDAERYRRRGLAKSARRLVDFARGHGIEKRTVLEIGGGIGAIQLELLKAGATRAENIELSPAYEPYAAELLRAAALEDRVDRRLLDFAEAAEDVEAADIVVMHRVVCCYPDYEALVGAAAAHAKRQLVLTYPRAAWWMRLGISAGNLFERFRRRSFRAYVHSPAAIIAVARSHGVEPVARHRGALWEFCGLERPAVPAAPIRESA
jgi:magnesium-protoporphyrin O-methyltransferase